jgi:hypothetical protein
VGNLARKKVVCVQRDIRYGDYVPHRMLNIESSNFLMMTYKPTSLSDGRQSKIIFRHTTDLLLATDTDEMKLWILNQAGKENEIFFKLNTAPLSRY